MDEVVQDCAGGIAHGGGGVERKGGGEGGMDQKNPKRLSAASENKSSRVFKVAGVPEVRREGGDGVCS